MSINDSEEINIQVQTCFQPKQEKKIKRETPKAAAAYIFRFTAEHDEPPYFYSQALCKGPAQSLHSNRMLAEVVFTDSQQAFTRNPDLQPRDLNPSRSMDKKALRCPNLSEAQKRLFS